MGYRQHSTVTELLSYCLLNQIVSSKNRMIKPSRKSFNANTLGKIFSRHFEIFFLFLQENKILPFMQLSWMADQILFFAKIRKIEKDILKYIMKTYLYKFDPSNPTFI